MNQLVRNDSNSRHDNQSNIRNNLNQYEEKDDSAIMGAGFKQ